MLWEARFHHDSNSTPRYTPQGHSAGTRVEGSALVVMRTLWRSERHIRTFLWHTTVLAPGTILSTILAASSLYWPCTAVSVMVSVFGTGVHGARLAAGGAAADSSGSGEQHPLERHLDWWVRKGVVRASDKAGGAYCSFR